MSAAVATADSSYMVHGRPIRPLPKRRLRSRLSEDADASLFSPPQPPATPLFYFPYTNYTSEDAQGSLMPSSGFGSGHHVGDNLQESSDEEDTSNASIFRGVGNGSSGSVEGAVAQMDSYEWSENTNNKKKRKIPTPTNSGGIAGGSGVGGGSGGGHSSPGFSPTSTSTPRSRWKPSGPSQRSPLSTISSSNHYSLRRANRRYPASPSRDSYTRRLTNGKTSTEEPTTPPKENFSVIGENSELTAPKKTQFTFVYESPVSASLALTSPMRNSNSPSTAPAAENATYQKPMHTVGTQTSPSMSNTNAVYPPTPQQGKKKSMHSRSAAARREYALQQQRRRRQEAGSGNNNGEVWICEFCEYESIFGEAPEALMRQYDIKDRKERRRLAEKRRLLEKAKQKGKKNSSKNGGKKNPAVNASNNSAAPPPPPPSTTDSQGTQSDNTPIASATHTPALKPQRHSQQVQTESYLDTGNPHVSSGRGASGGASGSGGVVASS